MTDSAESRAGLSRIQIGHQELQVDIRPGDGASTPLLLLNGIGAGLQILDPLVASLDPGIEVIRVDVPGTGGSPAAPLPYGIAQLTGLIARVLDRLGHRTVDVLGYSWGGALAQQFAFQYSGRCRRLVLISTSTGALSIPGTPDGWTQMLTPRRYSNPAQVQFMEGILDGDGATLPKDDALPDDDARRLLEAATANASVIGYLHQLLAVGTWTSLPFLPLLRQPVLVLSGDRDPIVPLANSRILALLIPGSRLVLLAGGHATIITAAAQVAATVSAFLDSPFPETAVSRS